MRLHKIAIQNFRLLKEVELQFDPRTTVVVGRNNSGKTSLTELFRRLLVDKSPTFRLEDFSLSAHEKFWNAFVLNANGAEETEIRKALPVIEVSMTIGYDAKATDFGHLGEFIIDLNPDSTEALVVARYQLEKGKIKLLFDDIPFDQPSGNETQKHSFFRTVRDRLSEYYRVNLVAVDPNDSSNEKVVDWSKLQALFQSGFINAQRGLDDTTHKDKDVLGKILESLFTTATAGTASQTDRVTAEDLEKAVKDIQDHIDKGFNDNLAKLVPALSLFGYPGLSDPGLRTETTFNVQALLQNHTKVRYVGANGVNLPEAYNGLGSRNLIFILLKLFEFFKSYQAMQTAPGIHLVFIEEPEAHLHPQMQEVFIRKLGEIAEDFAKRYNGGVPWPVQFVVSTHSPHLANQAPFEATRYFIATTGGTPEASRATKIKDLSTGLSGTPADDKKFLHQYMTLTRCDLLFADKAVLIEGTTERLLLPKMIEKVDASQANGPQLSSQYVCVMEVGGAYAHRFFPLLEFLELRSLIITDLDSVKAPKGVACKVSEGIKTSNGCIKAWFNEPTISPRDLLQKSVAEKTNSTRRLAYEVPEQDGGPCGRSFEDAFMLANSDLFGLKGISEEDKEDEAYTLADGIKKSQFALEHAIDRTDWLVPRYVAEGLRWLAEGVGDPATLSPSPVAPKLQAAATAEVLP